MPLQIIYKGKHRFLGWYQLLDEDTEAAEYLFAISPNGWTSRKLWMEWLKHFDQVTQYRCTALSPYRLLMIHAHDSHITLEFVKYCDEVNIKPYCLPPHSTDLLQPLDVGLFSPLQKAYGKAVDHITKFSLFTMWKGNFLPLWIEARQATYTNDNIIAGWREAGLIPLNGRMILAKLPHGPVSEATSSSPLTTVDTCKDSRALL